MTITLADTLLSAAPPLLVLLLLVVRGWSGARAGMAGWLLALVLAVAHFGAGGALLFYAHARAFALTIDVVYIIWAALLLYLLVLEAGALSRIAAWFGSLTDDAGLRILLLGWVFASFLQGVGGFGVPIAVVAPLLVGLGLPPLTAIVIPSIGHSWAVTFGSLGSSFIALLGVTGAEALAVGPPTAILLGGAAFGCGALVAHAYGGWSGAAARAAGRARHRRRHGPHAIRAGAPGFLAPRGDRRRSGGDGHRPRLDALASPKSARPTANHRTAARRSFARAGHRRLCRAGAAGLPGERDSAASGGARQLAAERGHPGRDDRARLGDGGRPLPWASRR